MNLNWMKRTHILSNSSLNLMAFCTSTFTPTKLIAFLNVHTIENEYLSLYTVCMLVPQIIPLLTLTLVYTWYEESTPRVLGCSMMN